MAPRGTAVRRSVQTTGGPATARLRYGGNESTRTSVARPALKKELCQEVARKAGASDFEGSTPHGSPQY